jgi:hypothetical protein
MSQNAARHDSRTRSDQEDDVISPQGRQPERSQRVRPHHPVAQPTGGGGIGPDDPDDSTFDLIGDDDLSPADLGPANPNVRDPDADSGRVRKIS